MCVARKRPSQSLTVVQRRTFAAVPAALGVLMNASMTATNMNASGTATNMASPRTRQWPQGMVSASQPLEASLRQRRACHPIEVALTSLVGRSGGGAGAAAAQTTLDWTA
eukprot:363857-Chlamydomonas_euryale.AAC.12